MTVLLYYFVSFSCIIVFLKNRKNARTFVGGAVFSTTIIHHFQYSLLLYMKMKPIRSNIKDASTSSIRQAMNIRRHELSQKIRKTKKCQMLQLKRRHTTAAFLDGEQDQGSGQSPQTTASPQQCFTEFIASPTIFSLSALQASLSRSKHQVTIRLQDYPIQQAESFLRSIAGFLSPNDDSSLEALKVLTNLSAMESSETSTNYYTSHSSWCVFMLSSTHGNIPKCLLNILASSNIFNIEQACWVIGNIAGDSHQCREKLVTMEFTPILISLLQQMDSFVILRNAIWALSNMSRGEHSIAPFIQAGLSANVLLNVLRLDESVGDNIWDIRSEIAWFLAFVSAKDEEELIAQLLNTEIFICLAKLFSQATDMVINNRDRGSIFKSIIPLIRIFGNLATGADGKYVEGIIMTEDRSVIKTLAKWLGVYKPCSEMMAICTEVTWVCGALLCDVGRANHASTTIAYPIILPALCEVFLRGSFTLEWKREIVNAIWNALAAPPNFDGDTFAIRDELLLQLFQKDGMVRALVGTLICLDVDAIRPALNIIDAMHRRLQRFNIDALVTLQSAECEHALEHVCDAASSSSSYGNSKSWDELECENRGGIESCADIAANLIDDFYGDDDNYDMSEVGLTCGVSEEGNHFTFGLQDPIPTFNFSNNREEIRQVAQDPMSLPAGRGRGRGRTVPAWMQKHN